MTTRYTFHRERREVRKDEPNGKMHLPAGTSSTTSSFLANIVSMSLKYARNNPSELDGTISMVDNAISTGETSSFEAFFDPRLEAFLDQSGFNFIDMISSDS